VDKINEARELLKMLGMPKTQQADICCYVLLAMAGIKPDTLWKDAGNEWIRIHDIIQFANIYYGSTYAENSRETFRKQALHHFRNAALVEENALDFGEILFCINNKLFWIYISFGILKEIKKQNENYKRVPFILSIHNFSSST